MVQAGDVDEKQQLFKGNTSSAGQLVRPYAGTGEHAGYTRGVWRLQVSTASGFATQPDC